MNHPWMFAGASVAALLVGFAASGGLLHVAWWIEDKHRRRRGDSAYTVDLTGARRR